MTSSSGKNQFYLTLPSNSSTNYFPGNKAVNFITHLPQPISLVGEWEVALVEMHYPHSFPTLDENNVIYVYTYKNERIKRQMGAVEIGPNMDDYFQRIHDSTVSASDLGRVDDVDEPPTQPHLPTTIPKHQTSPRTIIVDGIPLRKQSALRRLINRRQQQLQQLQEQLQLRQQQEQQGQQHESSEKSTTTESDQQQQQQGQQQGQQQQEQQQEHQQQHVPSETDDMVTYQIPEMVAAVLPSGCYSTARDLIQMINNQDKLRGLVEFKLNEDTNKVQICPADNVFQLDMSPKLALQLGFDPDEDDLINNRDSTRPSNILLGLPSHMYIYCDIVEPQLIGDTVAPLLQMVSIDSTAEYQYGSNKNVVFHRPHYVRLVKTRFETLEIDLRDGTGKPLPFRFGVSCVKLHFRQLRNTV